jgi:hypothetical protein
MTGSRSRRVGGFGALALGVGFFIVFPTLGLVEALAGIFVLGAHRPTDRTASLAAVVPTVLILAFAILSLVTGSGMDLGVVLSFATFSALTALVLLRPVRLIKSPDLQLP